MSTLAEIEAAIERLPIEQQLEIRRWMERHPPKASRMGWPVPPPDVPREELQRIHALVEAEFSQVNPKGW